MLTAGGWFRLLAGSSAVAVNLRAHTWPLHVTRGLLVAREPGSGGNCLRGKLSKRLSHGCFKASSSDLRGCTLRGMAIGGRRDILGKPATSFKGSIFPNDIVINGSLCLIMYHLLTCFLISSFITIFGTPTFEMKKAVTDRLSNLARVPLTPRPVLAASCFVRTRVLPVETLPASLA